MRHYLSLQRDFEAGFVDLAFTKNKVLPLGDKPAVVSGIPQVANVLVQKTDD